MLTTSEIISSKKQLKKKPDASELRRLPYKKAFIYGRLSTPSQVRDSHESVREIARLVALSKRDGYQTEIDPDEIEELLLEMTGPMPRAVQEGEAVIVVVRDLHPVHCIYSHPVYLLPASCKFSKGKHESKRHFH